MRNFGGKQFSTGSTSGQNRQLWIKDMGDQTLYEQVIERQKIKAFQTRRIGAFRFIDKNQSNDYNNGFYLW